MEREREEREEKRQKKRDESVALNDKLSDIDFLHVEATLVILGFPCVEDSGETQNQVNCFIE